MGFGRDTGDTLARHCAQIIRQARHAVAALTTDDGYDPADDLAILLVGSIVQFRDTTIAANADAARARLLRHFGITRHQPGTDITARNPRRPPTRARPASSPDRALLPRARPGTRIMTGDLPPDPGIDGTARADPLLSLDDGDIERIRRAVVDQVRSLPFRDRCAPARVGEFAIEETVLLGWSGQNWHQGVGVLLARRPEKPPGSADPRPEEAWYIQYGPGPGDVSLLAIIDQVAPADPQKEPSS